MRRFDGSAVSCSNSNDRLQLQFSITNWHSQMEVMYENRRTKYNHIPQCNVLDKVFHKMTPCILSFWLNH